MAERATRIFEGIVERWSRCNRSLSDALAGGRVVLELPPDLRRDRSYLIISNHRSILDIPLVHRALLDRVPFIRFFAKHELIFAPVVGLAIWALDMPRMKRHSREYLAEHPHKRNDDLETTRKMMRRFAQRQSCILNFIEGTRFTRSKCQVRGGAWHHLLDPKLGGIGYVVGTMGDQLHGVIDLTITYSEETHIFWKFAQGRLAWRKLRATLRPLPQQFRTTDILEDSALREEFRSWIHGLWDEKERLIAQDARS